MVFVVLCAEIRTTNEGYEGMGRSCDFASMSHDTEVSCSRVHKFPDTLTFLRGSGWNVNCVSMIG